MKVKNMSILIVILALILSPVLTALAQDGGRPLVSCNGLSDDDCQILIDSAAAMGELASLTIPSMEGVVDVTAGEESIYLYASGSGRVVLPTALLGLAESFQGMDPAAMDPDMLTEIYSQLDSELLMQALNEMGLHLVMDEMTMDVPGQQGSISLEAIFKDTGLYVRLPSPVGRDQWFGEALVLTEANLAEFDSAMAMLLMQLEDPTFREQFAQASELSGVGEELAALIDSHITTTRGDDAEMMGQSMRYFSTEFDLPGLLADPALPDALMSILQNLATSMPDANLEQLDQVNETQIQFLLMTAGLLVKDTVIKYEQWIGADDMFIHKVAMTLSASVDTSLFGLGEGMETVTLDSSLTIEFSDINSTTMDGVTIPADYLPLDATGDFLVGDASMIEETLTVGQTFSGSLTTSSDERDIYALALEAGDVVSIEIESADYPYLDIYGPDGMRVGNLDTYTETSYALDATAGGTYLLVVDGYWDMDYDLTVRAE